MTERSKDDAIETAKSKEPVALNRLLLANAQLNESREAAEAQSRRRDEAATQLAQAGVSYRDIARLIDATPERARQLVARHLGVTVNQLNPKKTKTTARH